MKASCFLPLKTRKALENQGLWCLKLSVCAKRNIIDAKHHIICGLPQPNHGKAVYIIRNLLLYIINSEEIAYHHCESRCTLMRDEIQRRHTAFDDIHRTSRVDDILPLRFYSVLIVQKCNSNI